MIETGDKILSVTASGNDCGASVSFVMARVAKKSSANGRSFAK